jgi:hypothetical protein
MSVSPKRTLTVGKIISGGQTGADRAALDFAMQHDIPHGGWLPKGRRTEEGPLAGKYQLQEMPTSRYESRTQKNILDSDGTLIVSHGKLNRGSALTRQLAEKHKKPWIHIDLDNVGQKEAARLLAAWMEKHHIFMLNVAGARKSEDARIYQATFALLAAALL